MSLDDLRPLLANVARDGDVGVLLDLVAGDLDIYDAHGQARAWSEGSEVDDLKQELKDAEAGREEAEEKLEAEEAAHAETKATIAGLESERDGWEGECILLRAAEKNGEPLPPPRPPPSPVNVGLVVAQKMADLLTEIGKRYQQAALKAGRRTAAGKAASALAFELLSAAEVERAKIPR
jgi:hypothetical protein